MIALVARRLVAAALLLVLLLTGTFFLVHLAPGDPTTLFFNERQSAEQRAQLQRAFGLDRPLWQQYLRWLGAAAQGDLGYSFAQSRPVMQMIAEALPATALLAVTALLVEYALALPLGVAAARRQGRWLDGWIRLSATVTFSTPGYWVALMAVLVFAVWWPVFPASHMHSVDASTWGAGRRLLDLLYHLALPAFTLGFAAAGGTARFVRNQMVDILGEDFIRAARARGLSERRVVWVHGLRNALGPLVQLVGLGLPQLLNGALLTEVVFSWPGIGQLTFQAILNRDYPLILGVTVVSGVTVILGNLVADLLHMAVDPRVRRHA